MGATNYSLDKKKSRYTMQEKKKMKSPKRKYKQSPKELKTLNCTLFAYLLTKIIHHKEYTPKNSVYSNYIITVSFCGNSAYILLPLNHEIA